MRLVFAFLYPIARFSQTWRRKKLIQHIFRQSAFKVFKVQSAQSVGQKKRQALSLFLRNGVICFLRREKPVGTIFPKFAAIANNSSIFTTQKVTITRLLWRSISCIKAFEVTKIHKGIAVNRFFQIAYTQEIVCS